MILHTVAHKFLQELEAPSDSRRKKVLEDDIQLYESGIKGYKEGIERIETR